MPIISKNKEYSSKRFNMLKLKNWEKYTKNITIITIFTILSLQVVHIEEWFNSLKSSCALKFEKKYLQNNTKSTILSKLNMKIVVTIYLSTIVSRNFNI